MTLRVVVLRDHEGAMHIIPNGELKVVTNRTRGWARSVVDVGVPYDVNLDRAIGVVRDEAALFSNDPVWAIQLDGPLEVLGVESLADSAIVIRTLIKTQPGSQWNAGGCPGAGSCCASSERVSRSPFPTPSPPADGEQRRWRGGRRRLRSGATDR